MHPAAVLPPRSEDTQTPCPPLPPTRITPPLLPSPRSCTTCKIQSPGKATVCAQHNLLSVTQCSTYTGGKWHLHSLPCHAPGAWGGGVTPIHTCGAYGKGSYPAITDKSSCADVIENLNNRAGGEGGRHSARALLGTGGGGLALSTSRSPPPPSQPPRHRRRPHCATQHKGRLPCTFALQSQMNIR